MKMSREQYGDLKIVQYGHPALREKAAPVRRSFKDLTELVERMMSLMRDAHGLGLAANQVGIPRRVAVVEIEETATVLIDPELVSAEGSETSEGGGRSRPRRYGKGERPSRVGVRARDISGKKIQVVGEGLLARALCHEVGHLNGKLFIDRADEATLHWLVGHTEEGEPIIHPTRLDEALKVFSAAPSARG